VLPLSDGLPARRFPIVNVSIIVANFAVWLFYELPHLRSAVFHASFYPCTVDHTCQGPESWGSAGGKNVEDAFGGLRYLAFYFAGGFVATMTQTLMTSSSAAQQRRGCPIWERAERSPPCSVRTSFHA
jgi:hypothetical protein